MRGNPGSDIHSCDPPADEYSRLIAVGADKSAIAELLQLPLSTFAMMLSLLSPDEARTYKLALEDSRKSRLARAYRLLLEGATVLEVQRCLGLRSDQAERVMSQAVRALEFARQRKQGLSLSEIANEAGLSRERVRQILNQLQDPTLEAAEVSRIRRSNRGSREREDERNLAEASQRDLDAAGIGTTRVVEIFDQLLSVSSTATDLGLDQSTVEWALTSRGILYRQLAFERNGSNTGIPGDQLLQYLQIAADRYESDTLTGAMYDSFAARQQITVEKWPTRQVYGLRFGSWSEACAAAGLQAGNSHLTYTKQYPRAACVNVLITFNDACDEIGVRPSISRYESMSADRPAWPSVATIRNRFDGSWITAIRVARITRVRRRSLNES